MNGASILFTILLCVAGSAVAQDWEIEVVDVGTKPELALDAAGQPHIAYMTEEMAGGVFYAIRNRDGWETDVVVRGYFYGPLDVTLDAEGGPHIVYHDHQGGDFDPDRGDAGYAFKEGNAWVLEAIADPGRDGWDGSIAVGPEGEVHVSAIDPSQFGSFAGVEWAVRRGGRWRVEEIGSGPVPYEFGTSLAVDAEGRPHIVYHTGEEERSPDGDLVYAVLVSDEWYIEEVDVDGDVGKFASLALDSQGRPHIAYFEWVEERSGFVKYAFVDETGWQIERVGALNDVEISFLGARRMISLALDANDRPHIAYADREVLRYVSRAGDDWGIQVVSRPSSEDKALGQLVSLALDGSGQPHLTYYELPASPTSSLGTVYYAAGRTRAFVAENPTPKVPETFRLGQNAPNPFNPVTAISYDLPEAGTVTLTVYTAAGQEVATLVRGDQEAGQHTVLFDGSGLANGIYVYRLAAGGAVETRRMVLVK